MRSPRLRGNGSTDLAWFFPRKRGSLPEIERQVQQVPELISVIEGKKCAELPFDRGSGCVKG